MWDRKEDKELFESCNKLLDQAFMTGFVVGCILCTIVVFAFVISGVI